MSAPPRPQDEIEQLIEEALPFVEGGDEISAREWIAQHPFDPADCSGTFDGFSVKSDADPGL